VRPRRAAPDAAAAAGVDERPPVARRPLRPRVARERAARRGLPDVAYAVAGSVLTLSGGPAGGAKPWLCGPGDVVTFQVVGERRDPHMVHDSGMMDAAGDFVPEYVQA